MPLKLTTLSLFLIFSLKAHALTITSLNIEWFGRGGVISGSPVDEYRIQRLRDFLLYQIPASDVLVLQEITAVELLQDSFPEYDCKTYEPRFNHQHVVLCALTKYTSDFFEIEDVDLGSYGLRPGSGLSLTYGKGGLFRKKKTLNIVGVHLKAGRFDHAWYKGVVVESTTVYGPCNEESVARPYDDFGFYNRFISDHCALQLVLE